VLHTVATATIKALLTQIAAALENTSAEAAGPTVAWQPVPEATASPP
jgi:hypothetical protein